MNKKKLFINSIWIFLFCFITHFIYDWLPVNFLAIFFPVNESTWEHMKMLYTTILLFGWFENCIRLYHHQNIQIFQIWIGAIISIPIYLVLYLPIYHFIGYHMWLALTILWITIYISQIIIQLVSRKENQLTLLFSLVGIIFSYIGFGYLTFHPILTDLFYDHHDHVYGLNYYEINDKNAQ